MVISLISKLTTGLLIDSERIYTEVTNAFLASHGKDPLPAEIKAQLMGNKSSFKSNNRPARTISSESPSRLGRIRLLP
jgi:beta-phosphoglucomutase-like phosphatase (HAD superfamily)